MINIIYTRMGFGKTTIFLNKLEQEKNSILLVGNHSIKESLIYSYPNLKNRIFSYSEWEKSEKLGRLDSNTKIYCDDIEYYLEMKLGGKIDSISFSTNY